MAVALPRSGCLRRAAWVTLFTRGGQQAGRRRKEVGLALPSRSPLCGQHRARCFPDLSFPPHCSAGGRRVLSWFYS